ncbi:MAG: hypothetical protein ACXAAM_07535 [Candidatus Heimdallarchaeaceae archaeon]|jgi:hypothetical protein
MTENEYQRLREFLLPFVTERFRSTAVNEELRKSVENIAKAFLWCLVSIQDKMHLTEITTISIAEAFYERGLYNLLNELDIGTKKITMEGFLLVLPGEIHNWLLFLQNNGQLRGVYDRFTGIYKMK